jgi:transcriptional regulator with XRE-family HTH domain
MTIAEKIKQARIEAGYTQQKFGELCGYESNAQGIVGRWESGTRPVPIEKLRTVAKLLNLTLDDLVP